MQRVQQKTFAWCLQTRRIQICLIVSTVPDWWEFGFAVAEMLIQSRKGHILLLPALPAEWKDGNVRGMKVQSDITVDFEWREGRIHRVRLCSSHEQKVTLECNGISKTVFLKPDRTENMIFDWSVLRGWNHWQPYHVKAHGTAVFSTWNIL